MPHACLECQPKRCHTESVPGVQRPLVRVRCLNGWGTGCIGPNDVLLEDFQPTPRAWAFSWARDSVAKEAGAAA